jgi:glycosyltransferase involved in cell wall biosynthesis
MTDFELIIVDDDSQDGTEEIVKQYTRDKRVKFFSNCRNLGAEGNWNRCTEEAKGTYFKLLPQDDILSDTCLEKQVKILQKDTNHDIAFVFTKRNIIDYNNKIIMSRGYRSSFQGAVNAQKLVHACIRSGTNLIGEPGGIMFRRSAISEVGLFNGAIPYVIDLDYWVRLLSIGDAYYLNETLVSFRVSPTGWSTVIGREQGSQMRKFIKIIKNDPSFDISIADYVLGVAMAHANKYLRQILYKLFINMNTKNQ